MVEQLNLVDHGDTIAKAAFRALLDEGEPLAMLDLAGRVGSKEDVVQSVLGRLQSIGRAETDGDMLLGIYGLTLKPTQHTMKLRGRSFFTWCAFDIVGIPAALGESAEISSECAHCKSAIRFQVTEGEAPQLPIVVSWLAKTCDSIREEFCPTVNFFCDRSHYDAAFAAGNAPALVLTLEKAAEMGRKNWGWARST